MFKEISKLVLISYRSVQNKRNDKISHHKSIIYEHDRLAPK